MAANIEEWLRSLGLQDYADRFAANAIDLSVLPDITEDDLRELEIPLGHRRKILRAIGELKQQQQQQPAAAPPAPVPEEAQRRQMTVMFCDLVGSSSLSTQLDPEDLRGMMLQFQTTVANVVAAHKGIIARYMGDGALVYFGYPTAHEDDAEQAINAGLALAQAVPKLEMSHNVALQVRVGIATGAVVVGDLLTTAEGARERSVVGDTPNLAARLQSVASPGTVVVCANTYRLAEGYFEFRDLGRVALKGWSDGVPAWEAVRSRNVSSRFEARHAASLTPLLGREEEIELIMRRWRAAAEGEGRVVVLSGESGIGKSHITLEIEARLAAVPHLSLTYYCSPHHANSALYPFISELERSAGFTRSDSATERLAKLETLAADQFARSANAIPLLINLLSLPADPKYPLPPLTPQQQKESTLGLLADRLIGLAASKPILILFEDAHWADPTSLELLARIVERLPGQRILLLVTARPEFTPPWPNDAHVSTVALTRLSRRDGAVLVERVVGGRKLPEEVLAQILARTDGVPLFIEELTKAVVESGQLQDTGEQYVLGGSLPALTIPTTLHASLMARLDRLASAREVAQVGAVIGREFTFELLSSVAEMSKNLLESALGHVRESGLILQRGAVPDAVYSFKHALVRETAYSGLLKSRRMQLHAALARVLETQFPEIVDAQPEILAHHFSEAGLTDSAVRYWLQAGRKAAARSANLEAAAHLQNGLRSVQNLQEGPDRDQAELGILMALGPCFIAIQGPAGPDASRVFTRAREICERLGDVPEYLQVMFWITTASVMRGQLTVARESIEALLQAANARGDRPALLNATRGSAMILMFMGRLLEAGAMIERAWRTFTESSEQDRLAARSAGQDAGVADLALMSWTLWLSGRSDSAAERIKEALARADAIAHPHSQAYACYYASVLFALRDEPERAQGYAERCLTLSEMHGFRQWNALARTVSGVLATLADPAKSLEPVKTALDQYRGAGYQLGMTTVYILLCQTLLRHHEYESALQIVADGLKTVVENSERIFEAELYRLQALALLGRDGEGASGQAQELLQRALDTAKAQSARALELRAACDLAELWLRAQRSEEARNLLAPLCASFAEGEAAHDLRRARTLLGQ